MFSSLKIVKAICGHWHRACDVLAGPPNGACGHWHRACDVLAGPPSGAAVRVPLR